MVTFTPVPHEECSSRTGSGDYIGSILNIFPWPFISLSLHLSESGFHSNDFVSVPTSFLSTLLYKKGQGTAFFWSPQFLHLCFRTDVLEKYSCVSLRRLSVLQLCTLTMEPHTQTHTSLQKKNPGACATFQVLEEMLLLESYCFTELLPVFLPAFLPCGQWW